jgi:hypothetical protein
MIAAVLGLLYDSLSLKKMLVAILRSLTKIAGSGAGVGSVSPRYGSADPDPQQNVTDPQHCIKLCAHTPEPLAGEVGTSAHLTHVISHSCA